MQRRWNGRPTFLLLNCVYSIWIRIFTLHNYIVSIKYCFVDNAYEHHTLTYRFFFFFLLVVSSRFRINWMPIMRRRFTFYSIFYIWKNSFFISRNRLFDLTKYLKKKHFLISKNRIFDIKNLNSWYQKINLIFWYINISYIRNRLLDIEESNSWYQNVGLIFLLKKYDKVFDIKNIRFFISKIQLFIIKNSNFWYRLFVI